jgi:hypothetical protein
LLSQGANAIQRPPQAARGTFHATTIGNFIIAPRLSVARASIYRALAKA